MDFLEIQDLLQQTNLTNEFQVLLVKMSTPVKLYRFRLYDLYQAAIQYGITAQMDLSEHVQDSAVHVSSYWTNLVDEHIENDAIHITSIWKGTVDGHIDDTSAHVSTLTWNNLTYNSTWGSYGAPYGAAQYSKDNAGLVRLRGVVKPNGSTSATIGTLPSGYRPPSSILIPYQDNNGTKTLVIGTDGTLTMSNILPTWVSLDNITFSV